MSFIANAEVVGRQAMSAIDPALADTYATLIKFLSHFPDAASAMRGKSAPAVGSRAYVEYQAISFASARRPRAPQAPTTVPDEMVSVILHDYFGIAVADLERAKQEHLLSMGAENLVGNLLERYLASVLEPKGWIWCSGDMVKAVDFVKAPTRSRGGAWRLLQVKNRDNSENSSSSAIRKGV